MALEEPAPFKNEFDMAASGDAGALEINIDDSKVA